MHLILKFFEDLGVVEVCVSKQAIKSSDNIEEMFGAWSRYGNPRAEIVGILNYSCSIVQSVDHVINCWTVLCTLMSSTNKDKFLVCCHLRASFRSANPKQLHHQQIEFEDKLSDMFILPYTFINFWWKFTNSLYIRWIMPYNRFSYTRKTYWWVLVDTLALQKVLSSLWCLPCP